MDMVDNNLVSTTACTDMSLSRVVTYNTGSHNLSFDFSVNEMILPRSVTNSIGSLPSELKVKLKAKPYDAKKSCWIPNKATHGYDEGLIESTEGDKVTVTILETGDVSAFMESRKLH